MKIVAIIPAHLASIRFPRKILFPFFGLPMIEHVRRRALLADSISEVYVATCDQEIADNVRRYGGKVIMTSDKHLNGTSRVAEAVENIECSHVILVQGDEPLLVPHDLDIFSDQISRNLQIDAWNATGPIETKSELDRHSFVKCAISPQNRILFCFRRTPFYSKFELQIKFVRKILGIIAYRKSFLQQLINIPPSTLEIAESIEQLRIIENGFIMNSVNLDHSFPSVNEPGEADIVLEYIEQNREQKKLLKKILGS